MSRPIRGVDSPNWDWLERVLAGLGTTASEPWHVVGAASEPAFQNGWVNYGAPYVSARFFKDPSGVVHLDGLVKNGAFSAVAFTLPAGYRPLSQTLLATISNSGVGRIDITPGGDVRMELGTSAWITLSGLSFRAEQ